MMGCLKKQWRVQPGLAEGRSVTFPPSVSVSIEMMDSQEPEQGQAVQAGCIGIEYTQGHFLCFLSSLSRKLNAADS